MQVNRHHLTRTALFALSGSALSVMLGLAAAQEAEAVPAQTKARTSHAVAKTQSSPKITTPRQKSVGQLKKEATTRARTQQVRTSSRPVATVHKRVIGRSQTAAPSGDRQATKQLSASPARRPTQQPGTGKSTGLAAQKLAGKSFNSVASSTRNTANRAQDGKTFRSVVSSTRSPSVRTQVRRANGSVASSTRNASVRTQVRRTNGSVTTAAGTPARWRPTQVTPTRRAWASAKIQTGGFQTFSKTIRPAGSSQQGRPPRRTGRGGGAGEFVNFLMNNPVGKRALGDAGIWVADQFDNVADRVVKNVSNTVGTTLENVGSATNNKNLKEAGRVTKASADNFGRAAGNWVLGSGARFRNAQHRDASKLDGKEYSAAVWLSRERHGEVIDHIKEAQRGMVWHGMDYAWGQPKDKDLTIDRAGAKQRRRDAHRGIKGPSKVGLPGQDRDEYPLAMTKEGGTGASVKFINAEQNQDAGRETKNQLLGVPDGRKFRYEFTD